MEYITALIFPFFVLLLETILPYPHIIEEVFKFLIAKISASYQAVIASAFLFSLSESVLYLMNPDTPNMRFIFASMMHITTTIVMYYAKDKKVWPVGIIIAIIIHYLFNQLGSV